MRPKRGEVGLTAEQIKATARQQMAQQGAAGVSLRGIGRELGVTAPAIYNYFARLDDLITELIIDAYNHLAAALRAAALAQPDAPVARRLLDVLLTYRAWAVAHPEEFALIFGTPIPGYHAPSERTQPAAQGIFTVILGLLVEASAHNQLCLPPGQPALPNGLALALPDGAPALPPNVLYVGLAGWYRIHGMIMLELFGHLATAMNQPALFYEHECRTLLRTFGLDLTME
jgi:AcrR family transcriptional regulator